MQPTISVIIPVYNVEQYLDRCVASVVKQTYKNLEIILVDDGSPDNCPAICDKWATKDNRIIVIHKENEGVSLARNSALDIAKGDYVCFVDSDDYVEKDFVSDLLDGITKNDADISICGLFNQDKSIKSNSLAQISSKEAKLMLFNIIDYPYVEGYVCNKMYKMDIIQNNSLRFDASLKMCEDTLFNYLYFDFTNNVCIIPNAKYHYCYRADSVMRVKPIQNDFDMVNLIDLFLSKSKYEVLSDMIVIWAFKYWIKAIDDYISTKTGKEYYNKSINCIRRFKSILLKSTYTTRVEKLFVILIYAFLPIYIILKKVRLKKVK